MGMGFWISGPIISPAPFPSRGKMAKYVRDFVVVLTPQVCILIARRWGLNATFFTREQLAPWFNGKTGVQPRPPNAKPMRGPGLMARQRAAGRWHFPTV